VRLDAELSILRFTRLTCKWLLCRPDRKQGDRTSMELDHLSLKELKKLQRDVASAIDSYETRVRSQALAELDARARELGFSLAELTGAAVAQKGKRAPAKAKYANPANSADTWSGRGRKPAWFDEALAQGASLEDLAVN
jgi:DNA-binding protein H-NS